MRPARSRSANPPSDQPVPSAPAPPPEELVKAAAFFEPMRSSADCFPTAILGTLKEAKTRLHFKGRLPSYRGLCNLLGCIDGGPTYQREGLVEDLEEAIRVYYLDVEVITEGSGSNIEYLAKVRQDNSKSYPLVSLHNGFLMNNYPDHFEGPGQDEHVVIVMAVDAKNLSVTIADPIMPYLKEAANMAGAIRQLSLIDFLKYWKLTREPNWLMAFRQAPQRKLTEYRDD